MSTVDKTIVHNAAISQWHDGTPFIYFDYMHAFICILIV